MSTGMVERDVKQALMLFPSDTVLSALRLMQRHGIRELPVVDDHEGELIGSVTEEELFLLWGKAPLTRMGELLGARALSDEPRARQSPDEDPLEHELPLLRASAFLH